jgi:Flp pilus assembly protein TadD
VIQTYLKNNQIKEAEKNLQHLKDAVGEDDIVYSLASISVLFYNRQFEEALSLIQEVKGKFEDSTKLLNLTAACYMGSRDFKKAEATLKKLYDFFENNKD